MTREEYRAATDELIALCSWAVNGSAPDKAQTAGFALDNLYAAARRQLLTGVAAYGLEAAGRIDPAFAQAKAKAIRKTVLQDAERTAVLNRLEEAGIWYMPLKGAVLKDYYPKLGMRQMCDNDILFDSSRAEDVRAIMESLGFQTKEFGVKYRDCYQKEPVCYFEMHRALFTPYAGASVFEYYRDVKARLIKDGGNAFGYHFSNEDFYLYMTAHEYKHFSYSGVGLRSLLDAYVFLKRFEGRLDEDYIAREAQKLGLAEFERQNRGLALRLFQGEALSDGDRAMLDYLSSSGVFGTKEQLAQNLVRKHGRATYLFKKLFPSCKAMCTLYPVLNKLPVLLPLFWLLRILTAPFRNPKKVLIQLKTVFLPKKELY